MKTLFYIHLCLSLIFQYSYSQEILNNKSVIDMFQLGFEEQVIIDKIESTNSDFDTSIEALKNLKESGLSPSLLSAMIKASKKDIQVVNQKEKKASIPKPDDKEFYWEDGKGELVKVTFMLNIGRDFTIDESELAGYTNRIMTEATIGLKSKLSFIPQIFMIRERLKSDKFLTNNDKTTHIAQLGYSATNSYGGMVEGMKLIGINPKLIPVEKSQEELEQRFAAQKFLHKKVYVDGKSVKMNGEIFIEQNFLIMIQEGIESSPIPIKDKEIIGDNHWKVEREIGGVKIISLEYNGNETKYKTDGGFLKYIAMGYEMVYPLIKSN